MTFPNAFEGVKKLFTSEILSLIAALCTLIAGIAGVVAVASLAAQSAGGTIGGGIAVVIFGIGSAVLFIIAYILKLVGLKKGGNDEPRFQQAFLIAIFALILQVVASILNSLSVGNGVVDNIVQIFATVAEILITVYVINGVQNLAVRLGNENMLEGGNKLLYIIIVVYVLAAIATLIPVFFGANPASATISGIFAIVSSILNIIAYIVFLVYLSKAKKMLAEGQEG